MTTTLTRAAFEAMTVAELQLLLATHGVNAYATPGGVSLIQEGEEGEIVSEASGLFGALLDALAQAADAGWFTPAGEGAVGA